MLGKIKLLFFPDQDLSPEVSLKWKASIKESYITSTNQILFYTSILLVIHLFVVDLPSNFKPTWLFAFIRISTSLSLCVAILFGKKIKNLIWYKIPYVFALSYLLIGQIILMQQEVKIPFFISIIFFVFSIICMNLSVGISWLFTTILYLLCSPMLLQILPNSTVPAIEQLASNYLIIVFLVCGFQTRIFSSLKLFLLNESNIELKLELLRAERLASLGTLSSGISHEINNALHHVSICMTPMEKYLQKIDDPETKSKAIKLFVPMQRGLDFATAIIENMKSYANQDSVAIQKLNIYSLVETVMALINSKVQAKHAQINIDVSKEIEVDGNKAGFHEIIMNLLINSLDAIPNEGKICVTASMQSSEWTLKVQDSGSGIPKEILNRIFEPFFTTKEVGKGTGLGLFIVHKETERHRGKLQVKSEVGKGTEFEFVFPLQLGSGLKEFH